MKSVAIIGAGVTGLTAAFYLKRGGVPVTVYEAGARAGGVIQSLRQNGFLAEFGPNTILETSPKISELIRDLNLESRRIYPSPAAKNRYVVRDKKPIAMPSSQKEFLTTKLFSARAKFALAREPFVPPRRDGVEESVAEFVLRRLNREFLDRAVDPFVAGIYAGDPHKLSIQHAFPKLLEAEQKYGSLLKGQFFGASEQKSGEISRRDARMFSFDEGLQVLPDALAAQLGDSLKLNTQITKLLQTKSGWQVSTSNGEVEHGAVIYCGTAYKLAELVISGTGFQPVLAEAETHRQDACATTPFSEIRHPPVASVVLGFRREDVAHPLDGFGMLIPKIENLKILGTIFSSSLFPNRAPENFVMLTSYVGGERQPELALLPPEKLVELVCEDLRVLLGVNGRPVFQNVALYPKAIPQYNVGYGKFKDLMNEIENKAAGLFFAGHFRDGISLGDSIVSGCNMSEHVAKFLTTNGHE
ncbi:MAG TPA: protoporphyrinogen oxidase [Verrucomicrobiae bacterium]|jgi:oxygen-dependent protoporphyrinogen oxidase